MYRRKFAPIAGIALALTVAWAPPALAQGAVVSAPLDMARQALALKPGEFVWVPEASPAGPVTVVVDLATQRASIYRNGVRIGISTISSGKPGYETPTGVFSILLKDAKHRSSKYNNAPMPFTQKLTQDGVALHAGGLPGYPESHGCVHLPLALARKLFTTTSFSTTVVISGRTGAPATEVFGGVVAPVTATGAPTGVVPLAADEPYRWTPEKAPDGPVSFILSGSDNRLVVLRNGIEIGRAKVAINGEPLGTHVLTLIERPEGDRQWVLVGVAGHADEANLPFEQDVFERVAMPAAFRASIAPLIVPGTTVLVTLAPINRRTTGAGLAVLASQP